MRHRSVWPKSGNAGTHQPVLLWSRVTNSFCYRYFTNNVNYCEEKTKEKNLKNRARVAEPHFSDPADVMRSNSFDFQRLFLLCSQRERNSMKIFTIFHVFVIAVTESRCCGRSRSGRWGSIKATGSQLKIKRSPDRTFSIFPGDSRIDICT